MTEAVPACFALPLSCITARSRATLLCTAQGQAVRLCPLLFIAGRNAKHTNPVAIMTKSLITPSRVRRRDTIETAHQSRLSLPSAKDHTSEGGFVSGPTSGSDRFIPFRATSDQSGLEDQRSPPQTNLTKATTPAGSAFRTLLVCQLGIKTPPKDAQFPITFASLSPTPHKDKGRVLQFAASHTQAVSPFESSILTDAGAAEASRLSTNSSRNVSALPLRVLDAPGLIDDFYVSLIDWSQQGLLAAALGLQIYINNTITCKTFKLTSYRIEAISIRSVAWSQNGAHLAVGLGNGKVDLWDISKMQKVRTFIGHRASVSALSWNSHLLSTGGADRVILHRDMRVPDFSVARLQGHRGHIAGLKWSRDDRELASGGNDNTVLLWRAGVSKPQQSIKAHTACVKALAWSPHQAGLLATGGGSTDRTIALWNTVKGSMVHSVHTGSQICGLAWSESVNELLSTHGYADNTIHLWKTPSLTKAATLTGHTKRVLFLAMSPDGQTAATGAGTGDETVRLWRVFPAAKKLSALKHVSNEVRCRIR